MGVSIKPIYFQFHLEPAEVGKDLNGGLPPPKPPAYDSPGKPQAIPFSGLFVGGHLEF
jgi:hypothetical protein